MYKNFIIESKEVDKVSEWARERRREKLNLIESMITVLLRVCACARLAF